MKRHFFQYFLLIVFLILTLIIHAQDIDFARVVIKQLTSEEFQGRGYVNEGDKLSAEYIAAIFDSLGLKKFNSGYFQPFDLSVNTLPGKIALAIDSKDLTPGEDFHVNPGSPSISGSFKTLYLGPNELLNDNILVGRLRKSKGRFIVIEAYDASVYSKEQQQKIKQNKEMISFAMDIPAAGVLEISRGKLTWFSAPIQFPRPVIQISASSVSQKIEEVTLTLDADFKRKHTTNNVIGYIEGDKTDSLVVITAHYDHLGMMGEYTIFPGANDNASGVALMLDLTRHYSEHRPPNTIVFIAFSGEELGLLGSQYFVENPLFNLNRIKFLLNFDIAGTGDEGIQVVNGSVFRKQFDLLSQINADHHLLPQVRIRGEACNSDHCFFYRKGVPAFFIYTLGGIQAYHDIFDKAETLPLTNYEPYFQLITRFIDNL